MRASELFEFWSPKETSQEFANTFLVHHFGFQEFKKDFMYVKSISKSHYITVRCSSYMALDLFNRDTMKSEDKIVLDGEVTSKTKQLALNKIAEWTRKFSDKDPEVKMTEAPIAFQKGDPVTYDLQPNKRNSPRGNAVFKMMSSKKNHAYIETETEGTIMVPLAELAPGKTK